MCGTIGTVNGMDYPKRKQNRLSRYDYSTVGTYFITVCTKERRELFWADVGGALLARKMWYYPHMGR